VIKIKRKSNFHVKNEFSSCPDCKIANIRKTPAMIIAFALHNVLNESSLTSVHVFHPHKLELFFVSVDFLLLPAPKQNEKLVWLKTNFWPLKSYSLSKKS
jgi:hypothetical protein